MFFVTGNQNKLREFEEILETKIKSIKIDLDELQAIEIEPVVEHKTLEAYSHVGKPVIVEDTGLFIEAWNGFPGALTKWVGKTIGFENIPNLLNVTSSQDVTLAAAYAKTIIGYYDGKEYKTFEGRVDGEIAPEARGDTNFGWDPIFIPHPCSHKGEGCTPEDHNKTFAQMSAKEKNEVSMRRQALEKLKTWLRIL